MINKYSNININKQTNFEYDFWAKVKALLDIQGPVVLHLRQSDGERDRPTGLSYLRQRVAECDGEGLALAVAPDVAL